MVKRKRYQYIDYTKGIGILLIMFAHVSQYFQPMSTANSFVVSFHVPIFFIASGLLMGYRKGTFIDKRKFLVKRARTLLIPYVIFSLFNSALKFAVLLVTHSLTITAVKSELIQLCITGNGTVWFLMTLFITEIIYVFCLRNVFYSKEENAMVGDKHFIEAFFMLACLIVPYLFGEVTNPFAIVGSRVIAAMGYYILGVMLTEVVNNSYTLNLKFLSALILTVMGVAAWTVFGDGVNFFGGSFTNMPGMISAIILSLASIAWLKCLEEVSALKQVKRFLNYYGRNSLIVMVIHPTLLLFVTYPLGSTFWNMSGIIAIVVSLIVFAILIIGEIPFIWFINKYIPFVIGKRKTKPVKNET